MQCASKNIKFSAVENWLNSVAYEHSDSERTNKSYRRAMSYFCDFISKKAGEILKEYEASTDREFKRKYASYLRTWIGALSKEGYSKSTIRVFVNVVRSFCKYNDLPLGHVPSCHSSVTFHNRDIEKEEILNILSVSSPRDRAIFCMMAQSGLRPTTLLLLRLKHIQPDFDNGKIPLKIDIPQEIAKGKYRGYFTFCGQETVKHLRDYLKTRPNLTEESLLFTKYGTEKTLEYSNASHRFRDILLKLKAKGILDFKQKKLGKPSEIRLYNLRKFFRKYAHQAGFEIVQFWMGHIVKAGQEEHYRPQDVEFHRTLYRDKAMPFLRLEQATPSETDRIIQHQATEISELRKQVEKLQVDMKMFVLTKSFGETAYSVEKGSAGPEEEEKE